MRTMVWCSVSLGSIDHRIKRLLPGVTQQCMDVNDGGCQEFYPAARIVYSLSKRTALTTALSPSA